MIPQAIKNKDNGNGKTNINGKHVSKKIVKYARDIDAFGFDLANLAATDHPNDCVLKIAASTFSRRQGKPDNFDTPAVQYARHA
jgi:hypothetical protein